MDLLTFSHRRNRDGSVDAICELCFVTVATARHERDLAHPQSAHVCDLQRIQALRELLLLGVRLEQ